MNVDLLKLYLNFEKDGMIFLGKLVYDMLEDYFCCSVELTLCQTQYLD